MYQKIIAIRNLDIYTAPVESVQEAVSYIGETYNVKFSFTFLKKRDFEITHYNSFLELCPPEYRSIEISNYLYAPDKTTLKNGQTFTLHFRTLFDPNNKEENDFDIFPAGTMRPMLAEMQCLGDHQGHLARPYLSNIYAFLHSYKEQMGNISVHLGIATNDTYQEKDGHSAPCKGAIEYCKEEIFSQVTATLSELDHKLRDPAFLVNYKGPLLIENLDYNADEPFSAYQYVCDPEMAVRVRLHNNTGLLLDVGHMLITVHNLYHKKINFYNALRYVDEFCATDYTPSSVNIYNHPSLSAPDYSLIKEIHFVVPNRNNNKLTDDHNPIYKESTNNPFDYKVAAKIVKHILKNRPKKEPLIINFETAPANAKEDMLTLIKDLAE